MGSSGLSCNNCGKELNGAAYRSVCKHIFCVGCSKDAFGAGCVCPTCKATLKVGDVVECSVGVEPPTSLKQSVYGHILQQPEWSGIAANMQVMNEAVTDACDFVVHQVC